MFHTISIAVFLFTFGAIALHYIIFPARSNELILPKIWWNPLNILKIVKLLPTLIFRGLKLDIINILRLLVYLAALFCFVILTVTGFYPPLVLGKPISGYMVMLHATVAPVFAVCVAILAVMWAHNCRFDKNYFPWLQKLLQRQPVNTDTGEKYELVQKAAFWLILILALPVILSIVMCMLPIFGTHGQEVLMDLHRYSALLLAMVIIVHTYLVFLTQAKK